MQGGLQVEPVVELLLLLVLLLQLQLPVYPDCLGRDVPGLGQTCPGVDTDPPAPQGRHPHLLPRLSAPACYQILPSTLRSHPHRIVILDITLLHSEGLGNDSVVSI